MLVILFYLTGSGNFYLWVLCTHSESLLHSSGPFNQSTNQSVQLLISFANGRTVWIFLLQNSVTTAPVKRKKRKRWRRKKIFKLSLWELRTKGHQKDPELKPFCSFQILSPVYLVGCDLYPTHTFKSFFFSPYFFNVIVFHALYLCQLLILLLSTIDT